jgi:hypothetical protein
MQPGKMTYEEWLRHYNHGPIDDGDSGIPETGGLEGAEPYQPPLPLWPLAYQGPDPFGGVDPRTGREAGE